MATQISKLRKKLNNLTDTELNELSEFWELNIDRKLKKPVKINNIIKAMQQPNILLNLLAILEPEEVQIFLTIYNSKEKFYFSSILQQKTNIPTSELREILKKMELNFLIYSKKDRKRLNADYDKYYIYPELLEVKLNIPFLLTENELKEFIKKKSIQHKAVDIQTSDVITLLDSEKKSEIYFQIINMGGVLEINEIKKITGYSEAFFLEVRSEFLENHLIEDVIFFYKKLQRYWVVPIEIMENLAKKDICDVKDNIDITYLGFYEEILDFIHKNYMILNKDFTIKKKDIESIMNRTAGYKNYYSKYMESAEFIKFTFYLANLAGHIRVNEQHLEITEEMENFRKLNPITKLNYLWKMLIKKTDPEYEELEEYFVPPIPFNHIVFNTIKYYLELFSCIGFEELQAMVKHNLLLKNIYREKKENDIYEDITGYFREDIDESYVFVIKVLKMFYIIENNPEVNEKRIRLTRIGLNMLFKKEIQDIPDTPIFKKEKKAVIKDYTITVNRKEFNWHELYYLGMFTKPLSLEENSVYEINKATMQKALFLGLKENFLLDLLQSLNSKIYNRLSDDLVEWVKPLPKLYIYKGVIVETDNEELFNELTSRKIRGCTWDEKLSGSRVFLKQFDHNSFMKYLRNKEIEVIDYGKK